jgi:hypothetical protein
VPVCAGARDAANCAPRAPGASLPAFAPVRHQALCNPERIGHGANICAGAETKVFWFFSSEKNVLPS